MLSNLKANEPFQKLNLTCFPVYIYRILIDEKWKRMLSKTFRLKDLGLSCLSIEHHLEPAEKNPDDVEHLRPENSSKQFNKV